MSKRQPHHARLSAGTVQTKGRHSQNITAHQALLSFLTMILLLVFRQVWWLVSMSMAILIVLRKRFRALKQIRIAHSEIKSLNYLMSLEVEDTATVVIPVITTQAIPTQAIPTQLTIEIPIIRELKPHGYYCQYLPPGGGLCNREATRELVITHNHEVIGSLKVCDHCHPYQGE